MLLDTGTRIGPYEILSPVGAGGMGEVYRARDTRLDRDVAIKILPASFASDPERLARFEREAKTLASLNHPHIAHIYGVEETGGTRALVMELVEGEDLAQRLARGAIPLDQSLPIARQIAEALEAAHERGIIHRDLKPANIKVTPDGTVKVLDFGLAKALDPAGLSAPSADAMRSPTFTAHATELGMILGTAAYMSPEQARGRPVDKRTDIWAFGAVLFEMLTGQSPFARATIADIMAAVVKEDPAWTALPPATPASISELLARCLRKDATQRLRDIGDARITIAETLSAHPASTAVRLEARPPRSTSRWRIAGTGAAIAGAAVAGFLMGTSRQIAAPQTLRTSFSQLTDQPGVEREPTIAPDGKSVVYVGDARGNADLYLLRVGGRKAVLLTEDSPADDYGPSFSPDGNRIAFRSERAGGGIFVMDATGESVRRVTDRGFDPRWSPDGTELVVADEAVRDPMSRALDSELWAVKLADGTRRKVAAADAVGGRWSPGGRRIVYWGRSADAVRNIWTVPSDGSGASSPQKVTDDVAVDWSPTWSPDGRFLYFASNRGGTMNLWRVAIDEASGRTRSEPEAVTTPTAWSGAFEFSADGRRLVFAEQDERSTIWTVGFDPTTGTAVGQPRTVLQGRAINSVDLSPDAGRVAFSQRGRPWEAIGVVNLDGSGWARLTDDQLYHRVPMWSPDGNRLVFYRNLGSQLWTMHADGSGLTELPLPAGASGSVYPIWSPEGSRIAVDTDQGLLILDVSTSPIKAVAHYNKPGSPELLPYSWSRDGKWLAGTGQFWNREQVGLLDVATGSIRPVREDGKSPAWLPDSRRLLYSSRTHIMLLDTRTGATRPVLPLARTVQHWGRLITLSRDARTLVYLATQSEGDVWMMTIDDKPR